MNFKTLLLFQIYIHIFFVVGLIQFVSLSNILIILLFHIIFSGLCGTVFYHRVVTHKNLIKSFFENLLLILSTIGMSGSALAWAATHRQHHKFSDTEKDPHSPKYKGYLRTYWYSSAGPWSIRYVPDLLRNKKYLFQHNYYFHINILYHLIIFITTPIEIYWLLCIVPGFLMWFTGSIINCFSHATTGPINNTILGILTLGEGWHKNHHNQASNIRFNSNLDLGYFLYKLIK